MAFAASVQFLFAALCAVILHGAGHILAARTVGVRFQRVRHTPTGFRLMTDEAGFPNYRTELIVTLGGPLGNLVGATAVRLLTLHLPALHPFGQVMIPLSLYLALLNLLPLRGFDGGGILLCLLCARHSPLPSLLPSTAERVLSATSALTLLALWLIAVYLLLTSGSALTLYAFCTQLFRTTLLWEQEKLTPQADLQGFGRMGKN